MNSCNFTILINQNNLNYSSKYNNKYMNRCNYTISNINKRTSIRIFNVFPFVFSF